MNDLTREAIRPNRAVTDPMNLKDPGIKGALVPATAGEAMEMAKMICSGKFAIPNYLHNNPGDCLRIVLVAARSGLDPFMLANESYLTKSTKTGENRMEFMAKAVHAIVLASGILRGDLGIKVEGQGANLSCTVTGQRRDGRTHTETYYMAPIQPKNSPLWQSQPRQQLIYYAERAWCRAHAPDALMGLIAREDPMIDVTPEIVSVDEPRGALAEVEAHLGVGDEPEDETESASGETEGHDPEGEAAAEQGRQPRAEQNGEQSAGPSSPVPAAEEAENGGQTNVEGDHVGKEFGLPPENRDHAKDLAWLKETAEKAETDQSLKKWLAKEATEKVVAGLPDDKHEDWLAHLNGVFEALGAMA